MGLVVAVVLSLFWIGLLILVIVASRADSRGQKRRSRGLRLKQTGFLLITVLLVRFGGNMVLSLFDLGWRCLPRNMMDMVCIVFARNKAPTDEMIELAKEIGIAVMVTAKRAFEASGILYMAGLSRNAED